MSLNTLVKNAYDAFFEQTKRAKIILLHPHSRYRSILVAMLINDPNLSTFYYSMQPDDINVQSLLMSVSHDLAEQYPTFGRHIHMLPQNIFENPTDHFDVILDTFVKDLEEIEKDSFFFVIDEFDRSDLSDEVQHFIERLSARLPENCCMVINSRTLPRLPWIAMIADSRAVLMKDDELITHDFYGNPSDGTHRMEVFALGHGQVIINDEVIDSWEGHLPRLLFYFTLDRPVVTRSEICAAFWPDLDEDQAVNVFHVTKRRLHKALNLDVLVHVDRYYRVNPDIMIYYDALDFAQTLVTARYAPDVDAQQEAWQRAIGMYHGPFLQGHQEQWIIERREEFRAGYIEALDGLAKIRIEQGDGEAALNLYKKALDEDNLREDVHRAMMQLFADLGRRSEGMTQYNQLVETLEPLDRAPQAETQTLYEQIKG